MRSIPVLLVVLALACLGWWLALPGEDETVDAAVPGPDAALRRGAAPVAHLLSESAPDAPPERQPLEPGFDDEEKTPVLSLQVLAGRVVNDEGRPVPRAEVSLRSSPTLSTLTALGLEQA